MSDGDGGAHGGSGKRLPILLTRAQPFCEGRIVFDACGLLDWEA